MKINLSEQLKHPSNGRDLVNQEGKTLTVGGVAENALWNIPASQGGRDHARLAMEIHGQDQIDLKAEDVATIKSAVKNVSNTLVWKAFDIAVDGLEDEKPDKKKPPH